MLAHRRLLPLVVMLVALAAPASADQPRILVTDVEFAPTEAVSLLIVPDGSGEPFAAARSTGGQTVDATIRFRLIDEDGGPIYLYPHEDVWLEPQGGTVQGCSPSQSFSADDDSDIDGGMEFALPVAAGGWSSAETILMVRGGPAYLEDGTMMPPFPLAVNSPDITGDLQVNLSDIVQFTLDLGAGTAYRSDFNWDGAVDLADIVTFVQHLGAACP